MSEKDNYIMKKINNVVTYIIASVLCVSIIYNNFRDVYAGEKRLILLNSFMGDYEVSITPNDFINNDNFDVDILNDALNNITLDKYSIEYYGDGKEINGEIVPICVFNVVDVSNKSRNIEGKTIEYDSTKAKGEVKTLQVAAKKSGYGWYKLKEINEKIYLKNNGGKIQQIDEGKYTEESNYALYELHGYEVMDLGAKDKNLKINTLDIINNKEGYVPYIYAKIVKNKIVSIDKAFLLIPNEGLQVMPLKETQYIKKGENVSLSLSQFNTNCKNLKYSWYKVDKENTVFIKNTKEGELIITNVKEEDYGEYKCIITGDGDNKVEQIFYIENRVVDGREQDENKELYNSHKIETAMTNYKKGSYKITTSFEKILPKGDYKYIWLRNKYSYAICDYKYTLPDISDNSKASYISDDNVYIEIINDTYSYTINDFIREGIRCFAVPINKYLGDDKIKKAIENVKINSYSNESIENLRKIEMEFVKEKVKDEDYSFEHPLGLENVTYMEQILPVSNYDHNRSNIVNAYKGNAITLKAMIALNANRDIYDWDTPFRTWTNSNKLYLRYVNYDDYGFYWINSLTECAHEIKCKDKCYTNFGYNLFSNVISLPDISASGNVEINSDGAVLSVNARSSSCKLEYTWFKRIGTTEELIVTNDMIEVSSDTKICTLKVPTDKIGYYKGVDDNRSVTYICKVTDGLNQEIIEMKVRDDKSFTVEEDEKYVNSNGIFYKQNAAGKSIVLEPKIIKDIENTNDINYTWYKDGKKIDNNTAKLKATYPKEGLVTYKLVISGKSVASVYTSSEERKVELKYVLRTKMKNNAMETTINYEPTVGNAKKCVLGARGTYAIKLYWGKVRDASGYRVFIEKNGKWQRIAETKATNYLFTGLASGNTHKFAVRSYRIVDGKVVWSETPATYTVATKPAPVKKFKVHSKTKNTITVQWNRTTGANGYRMYIMLNGKWVYKGATNASTYTFKGLKKNTAYKVAIRPYKISGKETLLSDNISTLNIRTGK